MAVLVPGVYGTELNRLDGPFGLQIGQMRGRRIVKNAGWYNADGQKIGWGDIGADDLRRIAAEIPGEEMFIVLRQEDAHWRFHQDQPLVHQSTHLTEEFPGRDYVAKNARYIVTSGACFSVDERRFRDGEEIDRFEGVEFLVIGWDLAQAKILAATGRLN